MLFAVFFFLLVLAFQVLACACRIRRTHLSVQCVRFHPEPRTSDLRIPLRPKSSKRLKSLKPNQYLLTPNSKQAINSVWRVRRLMGQYAVITPSLRFAAAAKEVLFLYP